MEEIESLVNKLDSCEYNSQVMSQVLDDVQKIVDKLNLRSYTNLSKWVKELDQKVCDLMKFYITLSTYLFFKIEVHLMKRLSAAINAWTECLCGQDEEVVIDTTMDTTPSQGASQFKLGGTPQVEVSCLLVLPCGQPVTTSVLPLTDRPTAMSCTSPTR